MVTSPVPDYFQEESEAALRSQVGWLQRVVHVRDPFFARVLRLPLETWLAWREGRVGLPPERHDDLRSLWRTMLHLLSFVGFDEQRLQHLLEHQTPPTEGPGTSPVAPLWSGSSLKACLEERGVAILPEVDRWVTAFRFGDPSAA